MSHLPAVYHDAQYIGQENTESAKQDNNSLHPLEAVSVWDRSDWSSFDNALYATCPLELIPETILNSIGKPLIKMTVCLVSLLLLGNILINFDVASRYCAKPD